MILICAKAFDLADLGGKGFARMVLIRTVGEMPQMAEFIRAKPARTPSAGSKPTAPVHILQPGISRSKICVNLRPDLRQSARNPSSPLRNPRETLSSPCYPRNQREPFLPIEKQNTNHRIYTTASDSTVRIKWLQPSLFFLAPLRLPITSVTFFLKFQHVSRRSERMAESSSTVMSLPPLTRKRM